jgi:hypothetical protein
MRKKFVCEFLNVSRPFQANWAWRGASSRGLSLGFLLIKSKAQKPTTPRNGH